MLRRLKSNVLADLPEKMEQMLYVDMGPDLMVVMQNYAYMTRDFYDLPCGVLFSEPMAYQQTAIKHSGNHRMEGILMMIGEDVAAGKHLEGATVLDIAPTVLSLLGHPVPAYMEGRVLREALTSVASETRFYTGPVIGTKAPTLHRMARQVSRLQEITARQSKVIDRQRRQLTRCTNNQPGRLARILRRIRAIVK